MEIAFQLRMPVYKIMEDMPHDELQAWFAYFDKRPIGWRDDDRASKIIQAQGVKEKPWNLFPSLKTIYKRNDDDKPKDAAASVMGSAFGKLIMESVGGEKIPFDQNSD